MRFLALSAFILSALFATAAERQVINVGTLPNDGTGDSVRSALQKANANFEALFSGQGVITDPGAARAAIGAISQVATIDALCNVDASTRTNVMFVRGRAYSTDGGGGLFYWHPTTTQDADGGTCFAANGVTVGRWLRVTQDPEINVRWFGAAGDGTTIDNDAFLAASKAGRHVKVPSGTYVLSDTVTVTNSTIFVGAGQDKTKIKTPIDKPGFVFDNAYRWYDHGIRNLTINGATTGGGIVFTNCNFSVIENIEFAQINGTAIHLAGVSSLSHIRDNFFWGFTTPATDVAIKIEEGSGIKIHDNDFYNCVAIEIVTASNGNMISANVFEGCTTALVMPKSIAGVGPVSFISNFVEATPTPFVLGETGSGSVMPGPLTMIGNEFAATGSTNIVIYGANGLVFYGNHIRPTLTFGENVTDLDLGHNRIQNTVTNLATFADKTVGNLTSSNAVTVGSYVMGAGNTRVAIKSFPTYRMLFGHQVPDLTMDAVDDTETNNIPLSITATSLKLAGRPIQQHVITDQNLFLDSANSHLQLSALNDAKNAYKKLDIFADDLLFNARPIQFQTATDFNLFMDQGGSAMQLSWLNDAKNAYIPLELYATSILLEPPVTIHGAVTATASVTFNSLQNTNGAFTVNPAGTIVGPQKFGNLTPSTLLQADGGGSMVSIANAAGFLLNNGSGSFSSINGITATITNMISGVITQRMVYTSGVLTSVTNL